MVQQTWELISLAFLQTWENKKIFTWEFIPGEKQKDPRPLSTLWPLEKGRILSQCVGRVQDSNLLIIQAPYKLSPQGQKLPINSPCGHVCVNHRFS